MKATGIVRRVDDLGRVVIPKEIRQNLAIREGDPLELFIEEDMVCFKKYETAAPLVSTIEKLCTLVKESDALKDIDEADAEAIRALAKILKKNLKQIEQSESA